MFKYEKLVYMFKYGKHVHMFKYGKANAKLQTDKNDKPMQLF